MCLVFVVFIVQYLETRDNDNFKIDKHFMLLTNIFPDYSVDYTI